MSNTATEVKPEETEIDRAAIAAEVESETETNLSDDRASIAAEVEAETEISPPERPEKTPKAPVDEKPETKTEKKDPDEGKKDVEKPPTDPTIHDTIENLSYRLKQAESRVGSLQNQLSKANREKVKPKDAPSEKQIEEASKDEGDWEELKSEFPLWGKAIDQRIAAKIADIENKIALTGQETAKLNSTLEKIPTDFDRKLELTTLSFYHPGWEKTVKSDEYLKWLPTQPEHIQAKHSSPSATDAIEVLDRFKGSVEKPEKTPAEIAADRQKRLKQSKGLEKTHKEKPTKSETDMSEDELRRKIASEVLDE